MGLVRRPLVYSKNNKYDKLQIFKSPLKKHYPTHEWNIPSYLTKGNVTHMTQHP
jgi:hypothetical protein